MSREYLFKVNGQVAQFGRIGVNPYTYTFHMRKLPSIVFRIPSIGVVNLMGYQTFGFDYAIRFWFDGAYYIGSTMGLPFIKESYSDIHSVDVVYDDQDGDVDNFDPEGDWIRASDEIRVQLLGRYGDIKTIGNAYQKFGLPGLTFHYSAYGMVAKLDLSKISPFDQLYWIERLKLSDEADESQVD